MSPNSSYRRPPPAPTSLHRVCDAQRPAQGCPRERTGLAEPPGVPTPRGLWLRPSLVRCLPLWPEWGSAVVGGRPLHIITEGRAGSSDLPSSALRPLETPFRFPTCLLLPPPATSRKSYEPPRETAGTGLPVPLSPNSVPFTPATGSRLPHLLATGVVWLVGETHPIQPKECR